MKDDIFENIILSRGFFPPTYLGNFAKLLICKTVLICTTSVTLTLQDAGFKKMLENRFMY